MRNFPPRNIPQPANSFPINVRQRPGYSYPKPVTHMHIREDMIHPALPFEQPHYDMHERIPGGAPYGYNAAAAYGPPAGYCPPGMAPGAPTGFVPPAQQ